MISETACQSKAAEKLGCRWLRNFPEQAVFQGDGIYGKRRLVPLWDSWRGARMDGRAAEGDREEIRG